MSIQMSMVLFDGKPNLSVRELRQTLSANWADVPPATEESEQDVTLSLRIGVADVVVGLMPAPVPWSDLEGPCATSILWPNAASTIREHKYHAIVTVSGELSPIELSTLLTKVTAALMISSSEALGVFWTNAAMIVPKALFFDFSIKILPLGPPVSIWIDCRVGWAEDKATSAGFTTGLESLGLMELETQRATEPPSELRSRFEAIARYLLENGPVIGDGHTIGESESEKIRVAHSHSAFGAKGTVMSLVYGPSAEKKPWWKRW
ncbi:DUF4261 domain-containing protein [Pelomonas sp. SE-A7]|uniref:DUF4261 domain-containing protein n=1 Tax=Pelomonas sp. SE-A7 TaxID=3054953 RepID=UPI00259C8FF8|nr:DUF4261 domain-containing protein [Pelomonas sp. SE-A7]MDM4768555.1 DUF4261 domain-containing protein [Pelomonas sp. SE-A7]